MVDFKFDREDIYNLTKKEWLVTNGIGGFASGTLSGVVTRRYHGLLVASLNPPVERKNLVAKLDPWVRYNRKTYPLFANQWKTPLNPVEPANGMDTLTAFKLDGTIPSWEFRLGEAFLRQRIWMEQGQNTTYVQYILESGEEEAAITLKGMLSYCDFHYTNKAGAAYQVEAVDNGVRVLAAANAEPYFLLSKKATVKIQQNIWLPGFFLAEEEFRGQDALADYYNGVDLLVRLMPGEEVTIVLSTEVNPDLDGNAAYARRKSIEERLIEQSSLQNAPGEIRQLVLAADQFIVERTVDGDEGRSVIAGYPWFSDWGRDTMIALPGLTLATRRFDIADSILRTFSRYVDRGMLPNRFPDLGEAPEYNTIDATLWYFDAIYRYYQYVHPENPEQAVSLVRDLYPVLREIIVWHEKGTRFNIHIGPQDGLLFGGEEGVQLTWMDAKVGNYVVTPRIGKPVEINALWYSALRVMAEFSEILGEDGKGYLEKAEMVKGSFQKFWIEDKSYCYDVLDSPKGNDAALRPNQVIAGAVAFSPLEVEQLEAIISVCEKELVTPFGLRSLAPDSPHYQRFYGGDLFSRDSAYHQGTVWGWLMGPFLLSKLKINPDDEAVVSLLNQYLSEIYLHGLGSISEIFDGGAPFEPRGCIAQAWSVAAGLQVWNEILRK
ncbi:amylo-alpha-1,6-glucosidase [bacterium]|nr:amylo-alpha-1,6-glucosidase [bacterium]